MKLSKRAIFVIVPVIFLSYCVAATSVYFTLKQTITRLEQNRLELAVTELSSSFSQYTTFVDGYIHVLLESKALRRFIAAQEELYRQVTLGASLEKAIRNFSRHESDKLSLLVVEPFPNLRELYYFELSEDPFATVSPVLQEAYRNALAKGADKSHWTYSIGQARPMIIVSRLIDRNTYYAPLPGQRENSVLVQFAMEPTEFLALLAQLKNSYGPEISYSDALKPTDFALFTTSTLGPDLRISVGVAEDYLDARLLQTKVILITVSLILFVLSSLLLFRLIRKYITGPIAALETELTEVMTERKPNITLKHHGLDEIGRLERSFHDLYGRLSLSYVKTKELSEHDRLTNLHNLSYISEKAHEALVDAKKNNTCVAFMYIDLDNFKFVNDKYGHDVGDALLKAFAARLTRVVRSIDTVYENTSVDATHGRIAGDEFSVIVQHIEGDQVPAKIARRILGLFQGGFSFELGSFPVSASIGIAMYPRDGHTVTQLVSNADNAMYQAKHNGKNNVAFYSKDIAQAMRRRMEIEQELKGLEPDEEFYLVYMPLIDSRTGRVDGFETLLRWHSPKLGFVGPDEFVPIAEGSGLFNKIDAWVLEAAIAAYAGMKEKLGRDFKLSINLSSAQLNLNLIGDHILKLVERFDVAPQNIQLEITETLNVEYSKKANDLLSLLNEAGFQLAIDDFGTGYTALLQLIEYPAQMIKFDKTFVEKAMREDNRSMLEPLIALCHSQDLKVTAEGVETEDIAEYLKSIGCDYLQGYLYGKPSPVDELRFDDWK